jgi:hypothetical protein
VHTGYGLTGGMKPKADKVKHVKASAKDKVSEPLHGELKTALLQSVWLYILLAFSLPDKGRQLR